MWRSSGPRWRGSHPARNPARPAGDILDVGGALAQVGIRNAAHRFEEVLHHGVKRILGILAAAGDGGEHALDHRAVLDHHDVRFENTAFVLAGEILQPALEFDELSFRRDQPPRGSVPASRATSVPRSHTPRARKTPAMTSTGAMAIPGRRGDPLVDDFWLGSGLRHWLPPP